MEHLMTTFTPMMYDVQFLSVHSSVNLSFILDSYVRCLWRSAVIKRNLAINVVSVCSSVCPSRVDIDSKVMTIG